MKTIIPALSGFVKENYNRFSLLQVTAIFFMAVLFLLPANTQAQTSPDWLGEETVRSHHKINMKPGSGITFIIKFKNTGNTTWRNDGENFVALATADPEKRESAFKHAFWNEVNYRPGRLVEPAVAPGQIGTFRFALQAPDAVGEYNETFMAVAKRIAWIEGTKFTIPITVATELPKPIVNEQSGHSGTTVADDFSVQDAGYAAEWINGPESVFTVQPGQQIFTTLEVKNTGSQTWTNSGYRYASLYTVRPSYHDSVFYTDGPGWMDASQIRLSSDSVKPGEVGKFVVMFQAPTTPGTHVDYVRLAAENYTWMKGGELKVQIVVEGSSLNENNSSDSESADPVSTLYKDTSYEASYLISSHRELRMKPGATVEFRVGFKNVGTKVWRNSGDRLVSMYTIEPNYRASRFATQVAAVNQGWLSTNQVKMQEAEARPGQLAYFVFNITAPLTPGSYTEKFRLAVEDSTWVKGGELTLPIVVEGDAGSMPTIVNPVNQGSLGPIMRVGLFSSDSPFSITADTPFEVWSGSGRLLVSLPAKSEVRVAYDKSTAQYSVQSIGLDHTSSDFVLIKALDNFTIMEILSFERRLPWNPAVNENLFRGSIEIRHSNATDKTWAINILPMEHYLMGISETSSSSAVEFLKVMSIAARTYGYYHYERRTKHADEHFYVDSDFDQVYRGYALEKRHPSLVESVNGTTGMVVTYTDPATAEKKIAITPYYSRSDGRTRSWSEVWGGNVPWCQSVPVPHDVGQTLWGHGVGMSARGGLLMVEEDGKTYSEVLHYFFTGIVIEDWY